MPTPHQNTQPSASTEEDARRLAFRAFFREMRGTRLGLSIRIAIGSLLLPGLYTLVISTINPSLRDPWVAATRSLTGAIAHLALTPNSAGANLSLRGFGDRSPLVSHILAAQWLLFGLQFFVAAALMLPERARLRAAFAASRAAYRQPRPNGVGWVVRLLVLILVVVVLIWWPLFAGSPDASGIGIDFAVDDLGLLFPGLVMMLGWWCTLYFIWLRLLALSAPDGRTGKELAAKSTPTDGSRH